MKRAGCGAVILEVIALQGRLCFNTGGQREFTCYTDFIASSDAALLEWTWSYVHHLCKSCSEGPHQGISSYPPLLLSVSLRTKKNKKPELLKCHLGKYMPLFFNPALS